MITRRPLPPCSSARVSSAKSYTRQNGLAQRPDTKAKLTRSSPPSNTCMIAKWASTSSTSSTPETRMKIQAYSSKLPLAGLTSASTLQFLDDVGADGDHRRDRQEHEQHRLHPQHLALPRHPLGPEVEQDDPQPVQRVEDDQHRQADLEQADERVAVGVHDAVVGLGGDVQQSLIGHVGEQVEENGHPGDAVQDPRPHPLAATVERSEALHPLGATSSPAVGAPTLPSGIGPVVPREAAAQKRFWGSWGRG